MAKFRRQTRYRRRKPIWQRSAPSARPSPLHDDTRRKLQNDPICMPFAIMLHRSQAAHNGYVRASTMDSSHTK